MSKCKAAAAKEMTAETAASRGRKRKAGEVVATTSISSSPDHQLKTPRLDDMAEIMENSGNSHCEIVNMNNDDHNNSDRVSASCCSSNGSKSVDLEEIEAAAAELIATSVDSRDRRETTPVSEVRIRPGQLESTARPRREPNTNVSRRIPTGTKTPSDAELEEFFSAAEKNMQQKFIEKYNYDIVKDEPIAEGRYEWVPIHEVFKP